MNLKRFLPVISLCVSLSYAQISYYSSYGFGIASPSLPVKLLAMGYGGVAVSDTFSLNTMNPALWAHFPTTSLQGQMSSSLLQVDKLDYRSSANEFMGFSIKFPISKRTGIALGVHPETRISATKSVTDSTEFGDLYVPYKFTTDANGGISSFFFGGGFQLRDNLYLGIQAKLLFGEILVERSTDIDIDDNDDGYFKRAEEIRGTQVGVGAAWSDRTNRTKIGLSYERSLRFRTRARYDYTFGPDTTFDFRTLKYPSNLRIGFSSIFWNKLLISADFSLTSIDKSIFQKFYLFEPVASKDSYGFGLGIERQSEYKYQSSFWKQLSLRGGFYFKTAPFYNSKRVEERGVTLGLGVPFGAFRNRIDLAVVLAKRNGFLQAVGDENILSFHIGITTGEVWFRRVRRY